MYETTFYTKLDSSTIQKVIKAIGQTFGKTETALQLHELPFFGLNDVKSINMEADYIDCIHIHGNIRSCMNITSINK